MFRTLTLAGNSVTENTPRQITADINGVLKETVNPYGIA